MTPEQKQIIKRLQNLANDWPEGISLFSSAGSLCVIDDTHKILAVINIPNDGGDPGSRVDDEGNEFLCLDI